MKPRLAAVAVFAATWRRVWIRMRETSQRYGRSLRRTTRRDHDLRCKGATDFRPAMPQTNERVRIFFDLDTGIRQPQNEAQRHFVLVCRGDAAPVTMQERVYLNIRTGQGFSSLDLDEDGPKPSVPRPDLGPREWDHYEYNKCK